MTATVIIPTTGNSQLAGAIESVLNQKYPTNCYVVCDGDKYSSDVKSITNQYLGDGRIKVCYLPDNVGANGFYGHRIYAAFTHLVNTKYILYLDQDCIFRPDHVESCINTIESNNLDWCYSLRAIVDKDGMKKCQRWLEYSFSRAHQHLKCVVIESYNDVKGCVDIQKKMIDQGADPAYLNADQFTKYLAAEMPRWAKAVKQAGAKLD